MRPLIALTLALLASALVALVVRLRRDARPGWTEPEIVGMPTWPYRGDVS